MVRESTFAVFMLTMRGARSFAAVRQLAPLSLMPISDSGDIGESGVVMSTSCSLKFRSWRIAAARDMSARRHKGCAVLRVALRQKGQRYERLSEKELSWG
jgi:hypothetical protein